MNKDSILKFGKYQGCTVEEVWTGRINTDESDVIRGYLQELLDFFAGFRQDDVIIPASDAEFTKCETELSSIINDTPPFNSYVTNKYIILESNDEHVINSLKVVLKTSPTGIFYLLSVKPIGFTPLERLTTQMSFHITIQSTLNNSLAYRQTQII